MENMSEILCPECGVTCKNNKQFLTHKRIHNKTKYKCDSFVKEVVGAIAFNNHKVSHLTVICPKCNTEIKKGSMKDHKVHCEQDKEEYKCKECDFKTNYLCILKVHMERKQRTVKVKKEVFKNHLEQ